MELFVSGKRWDRTHPTLVSENQYFRVWNAPSAAELHRKGVLEEASTVSVKATAL